MLARLFVLFGGLFVLALLAALVGPYFIDWTSYRADFEREASVVLGRKVTVEGEASARILPFPSVTFSDVTVGGAGAERAMTVETFSMDAELAPLLHGEVLIFDMRLVRPRAVIDIAADGTVDWAMRPSSPFDASQIALENVTITDGEVLLRHHASGRDHVVSGIDAKLSARSLAGPWHADGTMALDGHRTSFSASTGTAQDGAMRLSLDLSPSETPVRLALEGDVRLRDGAASYTGDFHVSRSLPEKSVGQASPEPAAPRPPGYRLSGTFALDQAKLAIDRFRLETGPHDDPYVAEGTASLDLGAEPRFAIEANGEQIRLDGDDGDSEPAAGLSFAERVAALEDAVRALPRPAIPGTVTLNLPALVAGDTTVRDVRLAAAPENGGWRIQTLSAALPGRTTLEASGLLDTAADFGFDGSLLLAVAQPSGFAAWLGQDVDESLRRLPAAGFSAKAKLSARRQSFENLELVLGDARLKGSLDNVTPPEGSATRPSLKLRLDGGRVDLDRLGIFASFFLGRSGGERFAGRDVDLDFKAGPVVAGDLSVGRVETAVTLRDRSLAIRRFEMTDVAGASISGSGTLSDLDTVPVGDLAATVKAPDLEPLVALAASRFPAAEWLAALRERGAAYPKLLGDARLALGVKIEAQGDGRLVSASLDGVAGGTDVAARFSGKAAAGDLDVATVSLETTLRSADGAPLLALAGLNAVPLGMTGPSTLSISASGGPADGLSAKAELKAAGFSAGFEGTLSSVASAFAAKGEVALEAEDVEPWMLTLGAGLPGFGLGTPADLRADADYGDGLLVLTGIEGSVDEGAVAGEMNVAMRAGLPEITGALTLDTFDAARAAAAVLGGTAFDLDRQGAASAPFREKPSAPFTAALDISAGTVEAGALGTLYDADFNLDLDAGRVAIGGLTASFHDGALRGGGELKNSAGTGLLSAQFDLRNASLAEGFEGGGIQGLGDFSAAVSATGKSIDGLLASLGGSGTAKIADLHVAGLNERAFPELLAKGEAAGREVAADQVAGFAAPIAADGSFVVPRADVAFTIAGGVLRAPPVTLANAQARVDADLRADLSAGTVLAQGSITYAAGADALVGSEPALNFTFAGPFSTSRLVFDSAPLAQFLGQRSLEKQQARVEALQDSLIEKQRLRRESRYYEGLAALRVQQAAERRRQEDAVRLRAEERAAIDAQDERRAQAEAEQTRKAAEAIRLIEGEREAAKKQRGTVNPEILPAPEGGAEAFRALNFDATPGATQ